MSAVAEAKPKNHMADLYAVLAQTVRVWSRGGYFSVTPQELPNGVLVLQLKRTPSLDALAPDCADFAIQEYTDEEMAALLERTKGQPLTLFFG